MQRKYLQAYYCPLGHCKGPPLCVCVGGWDVEVGVGIGYFGNDDDGGEETEGVEVAEVVDRGRGRACKRR